MGGKMTDSTDKWAIDATIFTLNNKLYTVWSGWEGDVDVCQNLYIAEMSDPFTISSERVMISTPEYEWEKYGADGSPESPFINEGPYAFTLDGQLYISYSGAGSWCKDYCIALMRLTGSDPLDPTAWEKKSTPLFSANKEVFGAGHCSVIVKEDGKSADLFFHGWDTNEKVVDWNTVGFWHAVLTSEEGKLCLK